MKLHLRLVFYQTSSSSSPFLSDHCIVSFEFVHAAIFVTTIIPHFHIHILACSNWRFALMARSVDLDLDLVLDGFGSVSDGVICG